jgi:hypothetical protein
VSGCTYPKSTVFAEGKTTPRLLEVGRKPIDMARADKVARFLSPFFTELSRGLLLLGSGTHKT